MRLQVTQALGVHRTFLHSRPQIEAAHTSIATAKATQSARNVIKLRHLSFEDEL